MKSSVSGAETMGKKLTVAVLDEDKYSTDDLLWQVKVPLVKVVDAENLSLGSALCQLQPKRSPRTKTLLLNISQKNDFSFGKGYLLFFPTGSKDDHRRRPEEGRQCQRHNYSTLWIPQDLTEKDTHSTISMMSSSKQKDGQRKEPSSTLGDNIVVSGGIGKA